MFLRADDILIQGIIVVHATCSCRNKHRNRFGTVKFGTRFFRKDEAYPARQPGEQPAERVSPRFTELTFLQFAFRISVQPFAFLSNNPAMIRTLNCYLRASAWANFATRQHAILPVVSCLSASLPFLPLCLMLGNQTGTQSAFQLDTYCRFCFDDERSESS